MPFWKLVSDSMNSPPDLAICFTGQEEELRDKKKMDALYLHVKTEVEDALQYLQVRVTASTLALFPILYSSILSYLSAYSIKSD